ncbi:hypothetical protein H0A65_12935 [Alcaligenaceae bacterium]|nr:hypothetical protein [Alcaligenaceae bacterium]
MSPTLSFRDSSYRYGYITRCLHWLMALVFAWRPQNHLGRQYTCAGPVP